MQMKGGCIAVVLILGPTVSSILAVVVLPQSVIADTHVGGNISTNTTWTLAGSPYIVDSDITIMAGVSLKVEAGVKIYLANSSGFEVYGDFIVGGTPALPVIFTNTSGSLLWNGIRTYSTARLIINNTDLGFVSPVWYAGIEATETRTLLLTNVTMRSNSGSIELTQTRNASLENVSFRSQFGMLLSGDENSTISNSTIQSWASGISGAGSDNLRIVNSDIDAEDDGLRLNSITGLHVHNSSFHSHLDSGTVEGLSVDSGSNIRITNSSVFHDGDRSSSSYWWALSLKNVQNVTVEGNRFLSKDAEYGFDMRVIQQQNTTITRNRFENTRRFLELGQGIVWNDTCCGSYWFDYNGSDWNGDGVGDVPFMIKNNTWDWLPLLEEGGCFSADEPSLQVPPGITQVTFETSNQTSPQVYHNYVMWLDSGIWKYRLYDFGTAKGIQLPHGGFLFKDRIVDMAGSAITEYQLSLNRSVELYRPVSSNEHYPEISDRYLIWNYNDMFHEAYLSYKDLLTGESRRNAMWAGWQYDSYDIEGDLVAFSKWTGHFTLPPACEEVSLSSLQGGWTHQLTYFNEVGGDPCPPGARYQVQYVRISGGWVIFQVDLWTSWTEPPTWFSREVYRYSIPDDTLTQLSPEGVWAYMPDVSEGWAVWVDNSSGDSDLVLLNRTNLKTYRLPRPGEQLNPRIYRNILVWEDRINGTWQVFVANLEFLLTDVQAIPSVQEVGKPVKIAARLLNVLPTDSVWVEVTDPDGTLIVNQTMTETSPDAYEYVSSYSDLGTHKFTVFARDSKGQVISSEGIFRVVDSTSPKITIISPTTAPGWVTNVTPIDLGGTSSDNVRVSIVTWSNAATGDSGTAMGTASWNASVPLAAVNNLITVTAWDSSGNKGTDTITVVFDDIPPSVAITFPADGQLFSSTPIVANGSSSDTGGSGLGRVEIRVNGGPWMTASGLAKWTASLNLAPGSNTVEARSWDLAGNPSAIASVTVVLDTDPPGIVITDPADGQVFAASPISISGTASDTGGGVLDNVEVRVNNGPWNKAAGTSSWTVSVNLLLGLNLIEARAMDNAGNPSTIASITVIYDPLAPGIAISSPANGQAFASSSVVVAGTASDAGVSGLNRIEVRVNGGLWGTATGKSSWTVTVDLVVGGNTIDARAWDNAGNPSPIESITVVYDSIFPIVLVSSPFSGEILKSSPVTVTGTATDEGESGLDRVEVRMNGGSWLTASGTSSWSASVSLIVGSNVIEAQAWDNVGNPSFVISVNVIFDPVCPSVYIISPSDGHIFAVERIAILGIAGDIGGSDLSHVAARVNGSPWQTATGTYTWGLTMNLSQGSNLIEAQSWDNAGHSSLIASVTVIYDPYPPSVSIISPANGETFTVSLITVYGTASDTGGSGLDHVEIRLNGGSWTTAMGTSPWIITVDLSSGLNKIEATSWDKAGSPSPTDVVNVTYAIPSNTPPSAAFDVIPSLGNIETYFVVDASASSDHEDATAQLAVRWDWENDGVWDAAWSTVKTAQHRYNSPGTYIISMEVRDTGGLADGTTHRITVENVQPHAAFTVTPSIGNVTTIFSTDGSASYDLEDPKTSLEVRWDWESDGIWDNGWSMVKTAQHRYTSPGVYVISLEVRDTGHLASDATSQVTVENTRPVAAFIVVPTSGELAAVFSVDASASSDLEDPADSLEVRWDWEDDGVWDTEWLPFKAANHQYSVPGIYTIRVEVRDKAGLTATATEIVSVFEPPGGATPESPWLATILVIMTVTLVIAGVRFLIVKRRRNNSGTTEKTEAADDDTLL